MTGVTEAAVGRVSPRHHQGLWYHVKRTIVGTRNLEMSLIDFMFRRKFHATGGNVQLVNCFNGYISVLKCE